MEKIYDFFKDALPELFSFVGKAIPGLVDATMIVKFIILCVGIALAAFAVVELIIGCFKVRFFRRLARVLLVIDGLGMIGLVLITLSDGIWTGDFPANMVAALKAGSPAVDGLISGIFKDFGDKSVPSFIIIMVAFVVITLLLHLVIFLSKKLTNKPEDKPADVPEADALPAEETPAPAPEAEPAPAAAAPAPAVAVAPAKPTEEPIVPADVPEAEIETVNESDAAPAVAEAATEAPATEGDPAEAKVNEVEAPVPDYPVLDAPIFMPVPSVVSDTVDFTDAKRDGFTANPGVDAASADTFLSDEQAEDLTVVVYEKVEGDVVELPIDALNTNFKPYAYVDAKILRQKGILPADAGNVKITAQGKIEKPLMVKAAEFDPAALKMLILAGGRPIQIL